MVELHGEEDASLSTRLCRIRATQEAEVGGGILLSEDVSRSAVMVVLVVVQRASR
jgi:hypothetical protein